MAIKFLSQEAFKNITRNKSTFFLSSGVSAACLLLFTIFLVLTINIYRIKATVEDRIEISAFLTDNADQIELTDKIMQLDGVKQVQYISKDDALKELRTDLGENSNILDILQRNPLPASLRIKINPDYKLPTKLGELEQKISLLKGIRETWSGKDIIVRLHNIISVVTGFDIGILLIVFISVIFIVSRTVEATILARAREIEIMKLVGATSAMVKFPFYVEGFFHGLLGSIVSFLITVIIFYFISSFVPFLQMPYLLILVFNIFWGSILGIGGSYIALSRILK
jgi:cell division transport system permease protein